ncbi:MAG: hypothetical protein LBS28_03225 [Streptococcaceae bacterium]|jgi:hypothetical protein|nr:hypothetical protein [Streptococcaceae bacterium]
MFDVITSDKQTQELLRMKEKGERDFNPAMKNSRIKGRTEGMEKGLKKQHYPCSQTSCQCQLLKIH